MKAAPRKVYAFLFAALVAMGLAQEEHLNPYAQLNTVQEISLLIDGTNREILISSSSIYHPEIAEALRSAMLNRGVQVFVLTDSKGVNNPSAYIHSLHLQGAVVRVGESSDPLMVLDRQAVVSGPLLTGPIALTENSGTFLLSDPGFINQAVNLIIEHFERALPFEYVPAPPAP